MANSDRGGDADPGGEAEEAQPRTGYCQPPEHTKFKKGKSGNPRGRPKGSKSVAAIVREQCAVKVPLRDGGKMRNVAMAEAIIMRTLREGLTGSNQAIDRALRLVERFGPTEPDTPEEYGNLELLTDEELDVMERLSRKAYGYPPREADSDATAES